MAVKKEKFDPSRIQMLKDYLTDQQHDGCPRPFEIFVDELRVVMRTEELSRFDNYEKYLRPDTGYILIKLYYNSSPNNDQYFFYLREDAGEGGGLNGLEKIVTQRLNDRDKDYQISRLTEELEKIKADLEQAEEYSEELEAKIEELKNQKHGIGKINVGELAVSTLEALVQRNPKWLNNTTVGKTLAGLVAGDPSKAEPETEAEAAFKKKTDQPEMNENEQVILELIRNLEKTMDESQLRLTALIIQKLSAEPQQVLPVAELLSVDK